MHVFVTGAAGFIGRAVIQELRNNGHTVLGLARSDANAEILTKAGAEVQRGDLEDIESLKSGAKASDGVIHLAFNHDFTNFVKSAAIDAAAITAMGEAMAGTGNPLVIASGTGGAPTGTLATEDTKADPNSPLSARSQGSDAVLALSKEKGIRGSIVRLPPTVHDGTEDKAFIRMFINMAEKNGYATYIGDGSARWPAAYRADVAVLFRIALEKGKAGATYNAVAEQGVSTKDIAELIGKKLGIPAESKTVSEAAESLGMLAHFLGSDLPTSSEKTQKELGWTPKGPGLLEDMEKNYFSGDVKSTFFAS